MANANLTQHEQILKSFAHSLQEIMDHQQKTQEALTQMQHIMGQAQVHLKQACAEVTSLILPLERLRWIRLKLELEHDKP